MTPPPSSATSPNSQGFPTDIFPLDFLSFGLDANSPSNQFTPSHQPQSSSSQHPTPNPNLGGFDNHNQPEAGPSSIPYNGNNNQNYQYGESISGDRRGSLSESSSRGGSSRGGKGRGRTRKDSSRGGGNSRAKGDQGGGMMDIDQEISNFGNTGNNNSNGGVGQAEHSGEMTANQIEEMIAGLQNNQNQLGDISSGMLQQFEGIHMQSPLVFDPNKSNQMYNAMAQYLSSPNVQNPEEVRKMRNVVMHGGLITPAQSGEMFPQTRLDQMSPMQLEKLARGELLDGMPELNVMPLLSPALTQPSSSQFTSPAQGAAFYSQSPLEALQEQQRQFQEQLNALQVQQKQLQATAAAVAAVSAAQGGNTFVNPNNGTNTPGGGYVNGHSGGSSVKSRSVTTPGAIGSTEASPSYFSPLTSPALEARHYHNYPSASSSNNFNRQQMRPHPLSALSSPALNPIGSSGGANQTLSPALGPVNGGDGLTEPDYIRALVGMLEGKLENNQGDQGTGAPNTAGMRYNNLNMMDSYHNGSFQNQHSQAQNLPNINTSSSYSPNTFHPQNTSTSSHQNSPLTPSNPFQHSNHSSAPNSTGPGPHRQSLPPKSRPSPLIKPTKPNNRNHVRTPSMNNNGSGTFSVPNSPMMNKFPSSNLSHSTNGNGNGINMGNINSIQPGSYLSSNAIQPGFVHYGQNLNNNYGSGIGTGHSGHGTLSAGSTPSPVDLSSIMPPPPIPSNNTKGVGGALTPMTPAALMNLGTGMMVPHSPIIGGASSSSSVSNLSGSQYGDVKPQNTMNGNGKRNDNTTSGHNGDNNGNGNSNGINGSKGVSSTGRPIRKGSNGLNNSNNMSITPIITKKGPKPIMGKKLAARPPGIGVRAATKAAAAAMVPPEGETKRTSHKAAEQKRRDSLKAGFDELRLLLPPINTEALDPESGEPIPGSSAPRLLPKSSLVPDDNPNRGVSKVALLKFSNEYISKLHEKIERRDEYIEKLREEVLRLRNRSGIGSLGGMSGLEGMSGMDEEEVKLDGMDLLDVNLQDDEDDDEFGQPPKNDEGEEEEEGEEEDDNDDDEEDDSGGQGDLEMMDGGEFPGNGKRSASSFSSRSKKSGSVAVTVGAGLMKKRPALGRNVSSGSTRRKVEA